MDRYGSPISFTLKLGKARPRSAMNSGVLVRKAVRDEAAGIADVLRQSFAEFEPLYTTNAFAATVVSAEGVARRMTEGPVWVGLCGETIAGTASAVIKEECRLYVRGVAVVPHLRGKGIAAALLRKVESFARTAQCQRMYLTTTPFLNGAIRLYERWGFMRVPEGDEDLFGTPLFTMAKNIKD